MAIPSSQIDTWWKQGPITSSSTTYQSIKNALEQSNSPIAKMIASGVVKLDLQGSYAHDTNIYGNSDVDVIVRHTDSFHSNKLSLPTDQYLLHEQDHSTARYQWADLRRDVISALSLYYGATNIDTTGNKSLKVLPASGRLRADVVPVVAYRKYDHYHGLYNHSREDGVAFQHALTKERIINYPDHHYSNAVAKQAATTDRYKGLVRIFKNMRSYLVANGHLAKEDAPSYFLQGMVFNIPNDKFLPDRSEATLEALRWLRHHASPDNFQSQNGQHALLGTTGEYWNPASAKKTIVELCNLWDNWGSF